MEGTLYHITLHYMCAGVIVRNGRIVKAAPILGWSRGKRIEDLEKWVKKKNGTIVKGR